MKTLKMMLATLPAMVATPAWAASEIETGTTLVWVALAAVAVGALVAVFGSVLLAKPGDSDPED
jgi:hypothetical protein